MLKSNIWKLYVIQALRWFMMVMPVIVLFFQENGLSMTDILVLQALFSIAIIFFEIPSGYFSDVIGRKKTLILGSVLGFIGFLIYVLSYGFTGFLIAELTLGLGASMISGTDSAILYDTLIQLDRQEEYAKIEGRLLSVANFSEAIAGVIGGFVAVISLRTPFYIETIIMIFTIPLALTLIEPQRHKYENEEGAFKGILKIVGYSMRHNREVKWLILYSGFVGASTLTMVWFIQPYFKDVGLPLAWFGVAWGILNVSVGIFSIYAYKFELAVGRKKALISLIFLSFAGYVLLALFHSLWAIVFFLLFYFVRGINGPVLKDYVNRLITSDMRATVLSVKSLVGRVVFAIVGPFIGYIKDIYTFKIAFLTSGSLFVCFGVISLIFLHRNRAL